MCFDPDSWRQVSQRVQPKTARQMVEVSGVLANVNAELSETRHPEDARMILSGVRTQLTTFRACLEKVGVETRRPDLLPRVTADDHALISWATGFAWNSTGRMDG